MFSVQINFYGNVIQYFANLILIEVDLKDLKKWFIPNYVFYIIVMVKPGQLFLEVVE